MPMELNEKTLNTPWWEILLIGIGGVVIGVLFMISPRKTLEMAVQLLALYWIITGVLSVASIFRSTNLWFWKLIGGLFGLIAGVIVLLYPTWSSVLIPLGLVYFLGIGGLVMGGAMIVRAVTNEGIATGIIGIATCMLGIGLMVLPGISLVLGAYLLAIIAITGGVGAIIAAFKVKNA